MSSQKKASPRVAALVAEHEVEVIVVQLEDELVSLKEGGDDPARLRQVKNELREWRCVLRLGRPAKDGSHQGYNIIDGQLVAKEA